MKRQIDFHEPDLLPDTPKIFFIVPDRTLSYTITNLVLNNTSDAPVYVEVYKVPRGKEPTLKERFFNGNISAKVSLQLNYLCQSVFESGYSLQAVADVPDVVSIITGGVQET